MASVHTIQAEDEEVDGEMSAILFTEAPPPTGAPPAGKRGELQRHLLTKQTLTKPS